MEVYGRFDEVHIANLLSQPGAYYAIIERSQIPAGMKKLHIVKILANVTRMLFETAKKKVC